MGFCGDFWGFCGDFWGFWLATGFFNANREKKGSNRGEGEEVIFAEPEEGFEEMRGERGGIKGFYDGFDGEFWGF